LLYKKEKKIPMEIKEIDDDDKFDENEMMKIDYGDDDMMMMTDDDSDDSDDSR
jgi:hypothetical protein